MVEVLTCEIYFHIIWEMRWLQWWFYYSVLPGSPRMLSLNQWTDMNICSPLPHRLPRGLPLPPLVGSSVVGTILTLEMFSNQTVCGFSTWNTDVFSLLVLLLKYSLYTHMTYSTFDSFIHIWYWKPTNYSRAMQIKCVQRCLGHYMLYPSSIFLQWCYTN